MATRKNPDGSVSFITAAPGVAGGEFVFGAGAKRTLIVRDAQPRVCFHRAVKRGADRQAGR